MDVWACAPLEALSAASTSQRPIRANRASAGGRDIDILLEFTSWTVSRSALTCRRSGYHWRQLHSFVGRSYHRHSGPFANARSFARKSAGVKPFVSAGRSLTTWSPSSKNTAVSYTHLRAHETRH